MVKDIKIKGQNYRIITEPLSIGSPEGPRAAVFVKSEKDLKLDERLALPGETEESLLQWGEETARQHAESTAPGHS